MAQPLDEELQRQQHQQYSQRLQEIRRSRELPDQQESLTTAPKHSGPVSPDVSQAGLQQPMRGPQQGLEEQPPMAITAQQAKAHGPPPNLNMPGGEHTQHGHLSSASSQGVNPLHLMAPQPPPKKAATQQPHWHQQVAWQQQHMQQHPLQPQQNVPQQHVPQQQHMQQPDHGKASMSQHPEQYPTQHPVHGKASVPHLQEQHRQQPDQAMAAMPHPPQNQYRQQPDQAKASMPHPSQQCMEPLVRVKARLPEPPHPTENWKQLSQQRQFGQPGTWYPPSHAPQATAQLRTHTWQDPEHEAKVMEQQRLEREAKAMHQHRLEQEATARAMEQQHQLEQEAMAMHQHRLEQEAKARAMEQQHRQDNEAKAMEQHRLEQEALTEQAALHLQLHESHASSQQWLTTATYAAYQQGIGAATTHFTSQRTEAEQERALLYQELKKTRIRKEQLKKEKQALEEQEQQQAKAVEALQQQLGQYEARMEEYEVQAAGYEQKAAQLEEMTARTSPKHTRPAGHSGMTPEPWRSDYSWKTVATTY